MACRRQATSDADKDEAGEPQVAPTPSRSGYATRRRPTSPWPSSSAVARSEPLRSKAASEPTKAIAAPSDDTYAPKSTEGASFPASKRNSTINAIAKADSVTRFARAFRHYP